MSEPPGWRESIDCTYCKHVECVDFEFEGCYEHRCNKHGTLTSKYYVCNDYEE